MRLLVINPNINASTNTRMRKIAEPLLSPDDALEVVSAASGIELIETVEQSVATVPAVLAAVADRHHEVDAIIIAAFSDPGLAQARRQATCPVFGIAESAIPMTGQVACPVFGIAESAMRVAARSADRFTIVTLGAGLREAIRANATAYGFGDQLAAIRILPWTVAQVSADLPGHRSAFAGECRRALAEDGIGAVIIGGGPLSGMADAVAADIGVPVLDGVRCAIELALATRETIAQ